MFCSSALAVALGLTIGLPAFLTRGMYPGVSAARARVIPGTQKCTRMLVGDLGT